MDLLAEHVDLGTIPDVTNPRPDTALLMAERMRSLVAALATLDPRDCLLLKLRFEDDLSAREITALLGFPTPFHVYRRLNSLLTVLRDTLRGRGVDGAAL